MSENLEIFGAKTHNLKNINVKIPKNKMTVITGVSGSGKSSLAFSTIYNVGQQKYLESLSSYARMFIGGMSEEAHVDEIKGLSPTISIDQKTTNKNPRSTVGTITEIYDYYKLLFLNSGERICTQCQKKVKKDSLGDIIDYISAFEDDTRFILKAPIKSNFLDFDSIKKTVLDLGFIRFSVGDEIYTVNDTKHGDNIHSMSNIDNVDIIVDRLVKKDFSDNKSFDTKRLKDSLALGLKIGKGTIKVAVVGENEKSFSHVFVCSYCGYIPQALNISSFSFNSHVGACKECHGLGMKKVFLEEKIINPHLTLLEGAVTAPGFGGNFFFSLIEEVGKQNNINLEKKYSLLSPKEKKIILYGTGSIVYDVKFRNDYGQSTVYSSKFEGVIHTLERRYFDGVTEKGHYDDFIVDRVCPQCEGYRLNKESLSVYFKGFHIGELSDMSVEKALEFFYNIELSTSESKLLKKVLKNIIERLEFLSGVGLNYMTLSRRSSTLSGGEAQRIRLATQIGTKLEGIIYILDEPSIGLHPKDNSMLINNLKKLRDIGNTLIIVEHDEDIMKEADHIIDIGPGAGIHGGELVAEGTLPEVVDNKKSITGPYLAKQRELIIKTKQKGNNQGDDTKNLQVFGAKHNNLKDINVTIPLGKFIVVTGVSGGGKSSLVNDILANYLANNLNRARRTVGSVDTILGLEYLDKVVIIDQSPIGKTPRSNPATYTQVFTPIREIFSMTQESQIRGYLPGRFSFNTKQGRCNDCDGDGVKKIEMHFLPPVYVECESCNGKRYNRETLQIKYKGKTISDILEMTTEEALDFFSSHPKVVKILQTLVDVGLGYIKLGQSATTLSGGEAQRLKLSTELSKKSTGNTFYILDEPTTGLHFQDVEKLLTILHYLVEKGNSVLVIEHNMDIIVNADHIIDIGPEGGEKGGEVVATGTVADIQKSQKSYTGEAIKRYLSKI